MDFLKNIIHILHPDASINKKHNITHENNEEVHVAPCIAQIKKVDENLANALHKDIIENHGKETLQFQEWMDTCKKFEDKHTKRVAHSLVNNPAFYGTSAYCVAHLLPLFFKENNRFVGLSRKIAMPFGGVIFFANMIHTTSISDAHNMHQIETIVEEANQK